MTDGTTQQEDAEKVWQDVARSLAFWLDKHVDPPDGSKGCPDECEARRALARYRAAEADYFREQNADA